MNRQEREGRKALEGFLRALGVLGGSKQIPGPFFVIRWPATWAKLLLDQIVEEVNQRRHTFLPGGQMQFFVRAVEVIII